MGLDSTARDGITPEIREQANREQKRLNQLADEWVECPVCKTTEGGEIDMVEDGDAFLELKCKSCGASVSLGVTDPPTTWRVPTGEEVQARIDADRLRPRRHANLQGQSLSGRVLYYMWVARRSVARSFH